MCVCGKKNTCGGSDGCVRDWVFCFPFREKSGSPLAKTGIGWLADCRPRRSNPITAALWEQTQQRTVQACTRATYTAHTHKTLKAGFTVFKWAVQSRRGSVCLCIRTRAQLDFFPKNSFCIVFCHTSGFRAGWKRPMRPPLVLSAQLQPSSTECCFTASSLQKSSNKPFPQQQHWHEKKKVNTGLIIGN